MLRSRHVRAAGLHYLEHESMELKVGDKVWKIYGSPVRVHVRMTRERSTPNVTQAAPRYMPGSFQYKTDIEAKGKDGFHLFSYAQY